MNDDPILAAFDALRDNNTIVAQAAQITRLKADLAKSDAAVWDLSVENTQLKAELERLTKSN